ncbi:MAG: O-antigen ligase family protein [bacterium]|nr:MAG: O-antigen ligase family protein [bacterium]
MRELKPIFMERVEPGRWPVLRSLFDRIRPIFFTLAVGLIAGWQIYNPSKRVIEAIVGLVLVFLLWQYSTLSALWMLLLIYPFPFAIAVGTSTLIFTVIIFIIYLIRVSAGLDKIHAAGSFNLPIILFSIALIISFYNFKPSPYASRYAFSLATNYFGSIILFLMVINFIDDEAKLRKTVKVAMTTLGLIVFFTLYEMLFPGKVLVPGWLATHHREQLIMKGIRLAGPFRDFELLAEFFAMNIPIVFYMFIRSKRLATRSLYALLLVGTLFMLFATVTRGAFISLTIAVIYMAFLCRKDLSFVRIVSITATIILVVVVLEGFVARYTISGSMFQRLSQTTLERGVIPDTRILSWGYAVERAMEHPIIGHSPGWDFSKKLEREMYPHSGYLFILNITGFFGLLSFIYLLFRLVKTSMISIKESLIHSSFPAGLLKILHVSLTIFIIDQIKIEYLRNDIYGYFVLFFFGLIAATNVIIRKQKGEQGSPVP